MDEGTVGTDRRPGGSRTFGLNMERQLALAAATVLFLGSCGGGDGLPSSDPTGPDVNDMAGLPPVDLALPVPVAALLEGAIVNPFGVVRSSRDLVELGHSGIDLVSAQGTAIHAVSDGLIVSVDTATDGFPGDAVRLLLSTDAPEGEGWVFLYEHISLLAGLGVGSTVTRGERIATNPLEIGRSNHVELAWVFNNFLFHRDQRCWVVHLEPMERSALEELWGWLSEMGPLLTLLGGWIATGRQRAEGVGFEPTWAYTRRFSRRKSGSFAALRHVIRCGL